MKHSPIICPAVLEKHLVFASSPAGRLLPVKYVEQVSLFHLPYMAVEYEIVRPNILKLTLLILIVLPGEQEIEMLPPSSQTVRVPESGKGATVVVVGGGGAVTEE